MTKKEKKEYCYWTIEVVENGYLLKNAFVTAVFNKKDDLLDYIDQFTK